MKKRRKQIQSHWNVRIFEKPYQGKGVPVRLTSPIMNPDSAPAVIEVEGKLYRYGGWSGGVGGSFVSYNLTKPRRGKKVIPRT